MAQFIIKDDQGVFATVNVGAYETVTDAFIDIVYDLTTWFEHVCDDSIYSSTERNDAISELDQLTDDIRSGAVDKNDEPKVFGFTFKYVGA